MSDAIPIIEITRDRGHRVLPPRAFNSSVAAGGEFPIQPSPHHRARWLGNIGNRRQGQSVGRREGVEGREGGWA
jgi:hypothetical protein